MKVHYSKWISLPLLLKGLVCLGLAVWVALLEGTPNMQILFGAILSLNSVLFEKTPVLTFEADNIAVYRSIGLARQRFPFQAGSEIRIDGNQFFVGKARVPI